MKFRIDYRNTTASFVVSEAFGFRFGMASATSIVLLCLCKALENASDIPRFQLEAEHIAGMAENAATSVYQLPTGALVATGDADGEATLIRINADTRAIALPSGTITWDNLRPWMKAAISIPMNQCSWQAIPSPGSDMIPEALAMMAASLAESGAFLRYQLYCSIAQSGLAMMMPEHLRHHILINPFYGMIQGLAWIDFEDAAGRVMTSNAPQAYINSLPVPMKHAIFEISRILQSKQTEELTEIEAFMRESLHFSNDGRRETISGHDIMMTMAALDAINLNISTMIAYMEGSTGQSWLRHLVSDSLAA